MVGAMTTGAAASTRFFKCSAITQSLLSCKCLPCSFDSAPNAMTTTRSGVNMCSASSHERFSNRTPRLPFSILDVEGFCAKHCVANTQTTRRMSTNLNAEPTRCCCIFCLLSMRQCLPAFSTGGETAPLKPKEGNLAYLQANCVSCAVIICYLPFLLSHVSVQVRQIGFSVPTHRPRHSSSPPGSPKRL